MHSIIVVTPDRFTQQSRRIDLMPGQSLEFGRTADSRTPHAGWLSLPHAGISRRAGRLTAGDTHWQLTNLSRRQTYVVENPQGAGEHIKISPGRAEAPVPFEFSRVLLPAGDELLGFDVWAPRHDYVYGGLPGTDDTHDGEPAAATFPLDRATRYFLVLVALCAPRLNGAAFTGTAAFGATPTVGEIVRRLYPVWPEVTGPQVRWNIDYLAIKLRIKPDPARTASLGLGERFTSKKDRLAALALRFGLVGEDDLELLRVPAPVGDR